MPEPGAELWEKRDGETDKAYAAFCSYRDAPALTRSIRKSCMAMLREDYTEYRLRVWENWSAKHDWIKRTRAWDGEKDRQSRVADLEALKDMRSKHINEARGIQSIAVMALQRLQKRMNENPDFELSAGLILQLLTQGSAMERLARGEPDQIVKAVGEGGRIEVIWNGPPADLSGDAADASGPVEGDSEPGEV